MDDQPNVRRVTFELPADVTLDDEEMKALAEQFRSHLVDTKSEELMVRARPKEKEKQVPVIVQGVEKEIPKTKEQTA